MHFSILANIWLERQIESREKVEGGNREAVDQSGTSVYLLIRKYNER